MKENKVFEVTIDRSSEFIIVEATDCSAAEQQAVEIFKEINSGHKYDWWIAEVQKIANNIKELNQ